MKTYDMPQLSDEWFQIKLGKVGASSMSKVLAGGKGKTRKSYMLKLAAEILTEQRVETYSNAAMERGIELEPEARREYGFIKGVDVEQIGWIEQDNEKIGCSPDGIPPDGLVEIKCPLATTHIDYCTMPEGWTPPEYMAQFQGQMWVCEKPWVDFVSYCPEIKGKYIHIVRVYRDEALIQKIEAETIKFLDELNLLIKKMIGGN